MRVVIVGPGAIGCLLGVRFARAGCPVVMLDRRSDRAVALAAGGLVLDGPGGRETARVEATADAAACGPADLLAVCVKAYDTAAAAALAAPCVAAHTLLVSFQNGLGNAEALAAVTRHTQVLCAGTALGAVRLGAGHVRHTGFGPTVVAPFRWRGLAAAGEIAARLRVAGLDAAAAADAMPVLWRKLVINAAVNAVTALYGVPNGVVPERPQLWALASAAAREAADVARGLGMDLGADAPEVLVSDVCRRTAANRSSMLEDLTHGRRTEVEAINGAVVREAARAGMDAPVNRRLRDEILDRERAAGRVSG